jgi:sirohydrochlorin cobaltochelatase
MLFTLAAILLCVVLIHLIFPNKAKAYERPDRKPAIVLAAFGTTEIKALQSIYNIKNKVIQAFDGYDVFLAFTSNMVCSIWRDRASDEKFKKENPSVPAEIYDIKNALSTLASIQENGARLVLVQSLHVTDGEEYQDLENLVSTLSKYETFKPVLKPFPWIGVGEPALGLADGQKKYLDRAVTALAPLAQQAKSSGAALVLMGHGNEHLPQKVFSRLQQALRQAYGDQIYIGTVEASPGAEEILEELENSADNPGKALLAPLMVVAGDHAVNDMAGEEKDSWKSIFKAGGIEVEIFLKGLGSNDSWADIYVEHLKALAPKVEALKANDK